MPELPAASRLTGLTLRVRDSDAMLGFYHGTLGLELRSRADDRILLGPTGKGLELELLVDPDAPERPRPSVGLYHLALLLPDRAALARIVHRISDSEVSFDGFSDHGVSEAVYLTDPEGNGVELYRDRPASAWPTRGEEVAMTTVPLDVEDLLAEDARSGPLDPGTRLGHVHLHVADLDNAGAFYRGLGLRVRQSTYPGALFLAAGEYHHHVGLNTWAGDRRAPSGAAGLVSYTWAVPASALAGLQEMIEEEQEGQEAGGERDLANGAVRVLDPAGIEVRFEPASDGGSRNPPA